MTVKKNPFGTATGKIWMDDVDCRGNESALDECEHLGWGDHNCGHHEDVSLICVDNLNLTGNSNVGNSFELLTIFCPHKHFMIMTQTIQELWC